MSAYDILNDKQKALIARAMPFREQFKGTNFECDCGGVVYPVSDQTGECFACSKSQELNDCHYEADE